MICNFAPPQLQFPLFMHCTRDDNSKINLFRSYCKIDGEVINLKSIQTLLEDAHILDGIKLSKIKTAAIFSKVASQHQFISFSQFEEFLNEVKKVMKITDENLWNKLYQVEILTPAPEPFFTLEVRGADKIVRVVTELVNEKDVVSLMTRNERVETIGIMTRLCSAVVNSEQGTDDIPASNADSDLIPPLASQEDLTPASASQEDATEEYVEDRHMLQYLSQWFPFFGLSVILLLFSTTYFIV